jgi:hypothetical protein
MPVSELIAQAAEKAAKDLNLTEEEEVAEQPGDEEEASTEETTEEEIVEAEEGEEKLPSKKPTKTVPIERFNEVYSKMKQMERYVQFMATQQPKEQPVAEKPDPIPDLDELTNKELYAYMVKTLGKEMRGALKEAVNPLAQFVDSSKQERADRDVASVAATHSDYFDYAEPMMAISNRNPGLTAEEVYFLAKGDKASVTKSVVKRQKEKMLAKKKANVEKRSSPEGKISEKAEFKTVREAGIASAKKLGLL